jgi:hypothetical protein
MVSMPLTVIVVNNYLSFVINNLVEIFHPLG